MQTDLPIGQGKLFEGIIANHLSQEDLDLAESQCGFRVGRSTIDALDRVVSKERDTTRWGGIVGGVARHHRLTSFNAFNSLLGKGVSSALLRRVVGN